MNRPTIIINCAMSVDGKIALPNRRQLRISSEADMKRVHELRNRCDGVLVGVGAVKSDDPKLTVKDSYVDLVHQPLRIVLDTLCNTPIDALVVDDRAGTIICCYQNPDQKVYPDNVDLVFCEITKDNTLDLGDVLQKLYDKGLRSLLVEGGGTVIWNFVQQGFVDDLYVYVGPMIIGGYRTPTMADGKGITGPDDLIKLSLKNISELDGGILLHYQLTSIS